MSTTDSSAADPGPTSAEPEAIGPVVLWANGMHGTCEFTDANAQAGLEVNGNVQPLYGPGAVAFLEPGYQVLTLGSGVVGCSERYDEFNEFLQNGHVYLMLGWGDPATNTQEAVWVDITSQLTGDGGVVLVNLSSVASSVEFDLGVGDPVSAVAPTYVVVPGLAPGPITATPGAEPPSVPSSASPGHYWLVVYRDNADGSGTELARPAAVPVP